jgi:hypothetical protein
MTFSTTLREPANKLTGEQEIARPRRSTDCLPAAAGLFYFWSRIHRTPDKRYEHPLFHSPATRGPPDSGKTGLAKIAFCRLLFVFLKGVLAQRKPILLLRLSGSLWLRYAHAML